MKKVWRTDRRTDGQTDWTIHRAAWSQLKTGFIYFPSIGTIILNMRRPRQHLIFIIGISTLLSQHFYNETCKMLIRFTLQDDWYQHIWTGTDKFSKSPLIPFTCIYLVCMLPAPSPSSFLLVWYLFAMTRVECCSCRGSYLLSGLWNGLSLELVMFCLSNLVLYDIC